MGTNIFELNDNGDFQIVGYVKSDEEVNKETTAKIREKYSPEDEAKLNRIANALPKAQVPQEFVEYNTYAEQCRAEGRAKKQANADELATLNTIEIDNGGMPQTIYTR
ncbi:TPA: hypothetical protein DD449_02630 [Candidatus Berkelbacteria bacterium]|nr:hypothetical protein [Candidatus Berkelbacteria bacterium]